jgi:predicted ATPase
MQAGPPVMPSAATGEFPAMKRFILTGAPGSGKTAIIRQLELDGFGVVEEAATDVIALSQAQGIADAWTRHAFIDAIVELQKHRQLCASWQPGEVQFHDRSVICTAALAAYLGYRVSDQLTKELERIRSQDIYEREVFFIRNLGFVTPTEARRISFEDSLRFERIHEETYRKFGFDIIFIAPGSLPERVAAIKNAVGARSGSSPSKRPE